MAIKLIDFYKICSKNTLKNEAPKILNNTPLLTQFTLTDSIDFKLKFFPSGFRAVWIVWAPSGKNFQISHAVCRKNVTFQLYGFVVELSTVLCSSSLGAIQK